MATQFSGIITPSSMSFTTPDGKVHNVTTDHSHWEEIKATIKLLQAAQRVNDDGEVEAQHNALIPLVDIGQKITAQGEGRVSVANGVVYYDGEPVNNAITTRILWGLDEGFDMVPYMRFLDNIMLNPSKRAVDETYGFIEANNMGITEDGCILAYKRVREDFMDIYTGKMDNTPGRIVKMRRNAVDDNKDVTCSHGLHFCRQSYLPHYGAGPGNTIVVVKVNPMNVVSIPTDYHNAKARCCEYEVLAEYEGDDYDDLLSTKSVWSDSDFDDSDDDEGEWVWDEDEGEWVLSDDEDDKDELLIEDDDEVLFDEEEENVQVEADPLVSTQVAEEVASAFRRFAEQLSAEAAKKKE